MEICAVFEIENQQVLEPVSGAVTSTPTKRLIGYAIFENGQMISSIFQSYADAEEWMIQNCKRPR
jgi:hypothetical protein